MGVTLTIMRALNIRPGVRAVSDRLFRLVEPYPGLYFPLYSFYNLPLFGLAKGYVGKTIRRDTELVIEGFPRSGNTFALYAFTLAQCRPVKIAHRVHAPPQIVRAAHLGIPCCVLIRNPADAVRSAMLMWPDLAAQVGLNSYARFYRTIYPYRDAFVVAPLDKVVSEFGTIIGEINKRFATSFETFDATDANLRAVYAMMDRLNKEYHGRNPLTSYRPNEIKETLKRKISFDDCRDALAECNDIYRLFEDLSSA